MCDLFYRQSKSGFISIGYETGKTHCFDLSWPDQNIWAGFGLLPVEFGPFQLKRMYLGQNKLLIVKSYPSALDY